jgi:Fe2+ or Zn2+ uptake regulation protein
MTDPRLDSLDRLHYALLRLMAEHHDPLTTSELRFQADQSRDADGAVPLVNETVYRALRTLLRLGQIRHHRPTGRHVRGSLTPSGAHTAHRANGSAALPQNQRQR